MRLDRDAGGRCQLLFAVHPRFVEALPTVPSTGLVEDINSITPLIESITLMKDYFNDRYAAHELSEKAFQDGFNALDDILDLFETLVVDDVLVLDCSYQENPEIVGLFPRLVALKNRIPNVDNLSLSSKPTISSVSFGTRRAQYRVADKAAHSFNQTMLKIFSEVDRGSNVQTYLPVQEDSGFDKALQRAQRLCEASETLSTVLKNKLCHAGSSIHSAHLNLSGFEKPEFEVILSLCGLRPGMEVWQQVTFSELCLGGIGTQEDAQEEIRDICAELKQSYRKKRLPRMLFNGQYIYKGSSVKNDVKTSAKPSTITMRQILSQKGNAEQGRAVRLRELKKDEKQRLGLLIATSLLHLYGSPMLQCVLNTDTIYVLQEQLEAANKGPLVEAYIACAFSSQSIQHPSLVEDPIQGDPFVLALTTTLLELELGTEVVVTDDDKDDLSDLPSLYMAVTRLHADSIGELDPQYYHVIKSCIEIYDEFSDGDGKDYGRKIRIELFKKVVYPLTRRYEVLSKPTEFIRSTTVIAQERAYDSGLVFTPPKTVPFQNSRRQMETISELSEVDSVITNMPALSDPLMVSSDALLLASTGAISSSMHWLQRIDKINLQLNNLKQNFPAAPRVKIAILDTGCDLDASCLLNLSRSDARLKNHWHDWSGNSKAPVDEDPGRHGTALVALLLRVALHADVFVARVAKDESELCRAAENISTAINHAARVWDVDIITMSFGFPGVVPLIRDAIDDAIREKRRRSKEIVFFAAANNDGSNSEELFPASYEHVISVRGTDHTGGFVKKYNPDPWPEKKGTLYGTLGDSVPYDLGCPTLKKSGCSVATPVLTGIMAMIIQYVNYAASADITTGARLQTKEGVLRVLNRIADGDPGHERRRYVAPWKFFRWNEEDRISVIKAALAELQPQV